ncbi:DUF427 domain-containing protein [Polymorphobacter arshaanensis]|uniref:DUF427 domain-containing protein n=1 Tax=Glacieibacterium arshaanense TaxID=2511025 RepID=A0A4Y9ELX0_9SPHN|nr:DUF427 domain-containing protein [Polymorphobacter arshaanensis]
MRASLSHRNPRVCFVTITITPNPNYVRVSFAGHVIAESIRSLVLVEGDLPPVVYIPRADVDLDLCAPTGHVTHCPHKGDAVHFSIVIHDRRAENALWSYENPLPEVAAIAGHVAFYPDRVDSIVSGKPDLRGGSLA